MKGDTFRRGPYGIVIGMRFVVICALAVWAASFAGATGGSHELNPVRTHPLAGVSASAHRIIVKLRDTGSPAGAAVAQQPLSDQDRVTDLIARTGLTLRQWRSITQRMEALQVEPAAAGDSIARTLARLRADPDVVYAEADQRRYAHAVPNDPLFPAQSPQDPGQWYLQSNPAVFPSAVNAQAAWDVTKGSASLVIADLDTGVLYSHPDLLAVSASGRLLPGYCFISDAFIANGGSCPGAGASDPGDWVTQSDLSNQACSTTSAQVSPSSWHGTRTAGLLGALTNNATGIAGLTWSGQILPVRVLGKCGGIDSDIITGMLWAAGVPVSGAPTNPTPAKIINMSLGGTGTCPQSYVDAITQVVAMGVVVVVSAGNEGGPVDTPANCAGVAGVAGLRHAGTKVGFSSLGPEIALGAPAGNCVNTQITAATPCIYSIGTTTNSGTTSPATNTYTDQVNDPNLGTSFAAPIVSGIAALMASVNSHLNSCQLIARLQEGSQPFPQTSLGESSQPPACHVPASSSDLQTNECLCTLDGQTCGAGMANASGAVSAALRPIAVVSLPASVSAGQSVSLDASGSVAANGRTVSTYQWTNVGTQTVSIAGGTSAAATVTAPSCGLATVQVAVTDSVGAVDTAQVVLSPTSATSSAPSSATSMTCASKPVVMVAVCPMSSNVQAGSGTQSFTATVANASNTVVTWEVNGIAGGNSTLGTISSSGVYTAPASVPMPSTVLVQAISTADQSVSASTQVTILPPPASHGGGGAVDWMTLGVCALVLMWLASQRLQAARYASRCAASSHGRCARR